MKHLFTISNCEQHPTIGFRNYTLIFGYKLIVDLFRDFFYIIWLIHFKNFLKKFEFRVFRPKLKRNRMVLGRAQNTYYSSTAEIEIKNEK